MPTTDERCKALERAYMNLYTATQNLRLANEGLHEAEVKHRRALEALEELEDAE